MGQSRPRISYVWSFASNLVMLMFRKTLSSEKYSAKKDPEVPPCYSSEHHDLIRRFCPDLVEFEELYKDIHQHAELSCFEERTSLVLAEFLRSLNWTVFDKIGGHGVVGVLENGLGRRVMLRAELDALPIRERTNLPYASTRYMKDEFGQEQPVSHACGHDMHMSCVAAAAKLLTNAKSEWSGTLMVIFQPNEEHTGGARAMVDDGLYERIPVVPDVIMAQHCMPIRAGQVSIRSGPILVSADSVKIRVFSSEGHLLNTHINIDAPAVASNIIVSLQKLVKKLSSENEYASIVVEELHAGEPGLDWVEYVDISLDVKAYREKIRKALLSGIERIVDAEFRTSGASKAPLINTTIRAPLTTNDEGITKQVKPAFEAFFGKQNIRDDVPSHPCEDFSILAEPNSTPYIFWFLGRVDPAVLDRAEKEDSFLDTIPIEHSPYNAPVIRPTLETGMSALTIATLAYLKNHATMDKCSPLQQ